MPSHYNYDPRAMARARANRQLAPRYLKDTMTDLDYWQTKLNFYEQKKLEAPTDASHYPFFDRKLTEIREILSAFEQDARQLNRLTQ